MKSLAKRVLDKGELHIAHIEEQRIALDLLAHELFRRELSIGLSSMDWSAVLDESNRHAVTALLFPGVMRLSDIPDSFMSRICGAAVSASYLSLIHI